MTILLYQTDSYQKQFSAAITAVDPESRSITLDQSAFYPGGGGQPCDLGMIKAGQVEFSVVKIKKMGDEVVHFVAQDQLPAPGIQVSASIDWERRYKLMRTHTALHILCGVVFRDYGALVTGGDMEPLSGRMDFEFDRMPADLVHEIEAAVNKEVVAAREIRVNILPREQAFQIPDLIRTKINLLPEGITKVRTVEISGLDLQADGGTHVRSTAEVGKIRVVDYKSKGAINKRIYIALD
jgi:misacylated tRNA(Ala) deacylase